MAGAEYPAGQLFYQLALSKADRPFVDDYQLYKNPVDFQADPLKYGAETFADWVKKGYIAKDSAGLKAEDMGTAFIGGKCPMIVSGSWWYGRFNERDQGFDWGTFLFPGNKLHPGSSGNLWVVPENSQEQGPRLRLHRHHDAARRSRTCSATTAASRSRPTRRRSPTRRTRKLIENFNKVIASDGLAFYPDWPVPGYYDVLVSGFQGLINGSKTPDRGARRDRQAVRRGRQGRSPASDTASGGARPARPARPTAPPGRTSMAVTETVAATTAGRDARRRPRAAADARPQRGVLALPAPRRGAVRRSSSACR